MIQRVPWLVLAFAAWLVAALGIMGWITVAALNLEDRNERARASELVEERVRSALWRMDSSLAPIVATENARPYHLWRALYAAGRAYTNLFAEIPEGAVLVPSPLLTFDSPLLHLHFQLGPDDTWTSPQVPTGNQRDIAEAKHVSPERVARFEGRLKALMARANPETLREALDRPPADDDVGIPPLPSSEEDPGDRRNEGGPERQTADPVVAQEMRNAIEWVARRSVGKISAADSAISDVRTEPMRPLRCGDLLLLARRVTVGGAPYVQGVWVDWDTTRDWLKSGIEELLPDADLALIEAAAPAPEDSPSSPRAVDGPVPVDRRLATLPVRLDPGDVDRVAPLSRSGSRLTLAAAWAGFLVASLAVGWLLRGAVAIAERRWAFASSVTHELRTPLTTFRLYTDLLAEGMVDEARREEYLTTLRSEAERLGLLVENVLAWARIERGPGPASHESIDLGSLVERCRPRLERRAEQAGARIELELASDASATIVRVDGDAVERILFNLVDNACKYAVPSDEEGTDGGVIEIRGSVEGPRKASVTVHDHGRGIARREAEALFRPFRQGEDHRDRQIPGIGLGLALSRRLARSMGGDLSLDSSWNHGAAFRLTLERA